jgi:hypothetical protein
VIIEDACPFTEIIIGTIPDMLYGVTRPVKTQAFLAYDSKSLLMNVVNLCGPLELSIVE